MSLILILSLLFNLGTAPLILDAAPPELQDVQVSYLFGEQIEIQAEIISIDDIQEVMVVFQSKNSAKLETSAQLSSDGHLSAVYSLETNPFHVFDRVYFWFEITLVDGTVNISPSYWFDYLDNRYDWQTSSTKWFIVHITPNNLVTTDDVQEIALDGLKNATRLLPVSPELPIEVYVYPDASSLSSALGSSSQPWAAGEADPGLGVILVSETKDIDNNQELERQIAHELMHMLEFSAANGGYASAPTWLLEGLAVNAENDVSSEETRMLENAYRERDLIGMEQLCVSLPPQATRSALAYAQSASFTSYLSETYGKDKLLLLLGASGSGLGCEQLTEQILGKPLSELEADWIAVTFSSVKQKFTLIDYWPLLLLFPFIIIGLVRIRKHGSNQLKGANDNAR